MLREGENSLPPQKLDGSSLSIASACRLPFFFSLDPLDLSGVRPDELLSAKGSSEADFDLGSTLVDVDREWRGGEASNGREEE